jgi:hypothetical protein
LSGLHDADKSICMWVFSPKPGRRRLERGLELADSTRVRVSHLPCSSDYRPRVAAQRHLLSIAVGDTHGRELTRKGSFHLSQSFMRAASGRRSLPFVRSGSAWGRITHDAPAGLLPSGDEDQAVAVPGVVPLMCH